MASSRRMDPWELSRTSRRGHVEDAERGATLSMPMAALTEALGDVHPNDTLEDVRRRVGEKLFYIGVFRMLASSYVPDGPNVLVEGWYMQKSPERDEVVRSTKTILETPGLQWRDVGHRPWPVDRKAESKVFLMRDIIRFRVTNVNGHVKAAEQVSEGCSVGLTVVSGSISHLGTAENACHLSELRCVGGDLCFDECRFMRDLVGLEALCHVGNSITLNNCISLRDGSALSHSLIYLGGIIEELNCPIKP